jgi:hypothetical protein
MLSALNEFQSLATRLSPATLVIPGITAIGVGIVVWLGGIKVSRIISPVLGFALGAVVASRIPGEFNAPPVISAAIIGAIIAAIVHRPVMVAIGLVAFSSIMLVSLDSIAYHDQGVRMHHERLSDTHYTTTQTAQSWGQIKVDLRDIRDGFIMLSQKLLQETWPMSILSPLLLMVLAIFYRGFFVAMSSSSLGTTAILSGLMFLLLYGGNTPLTWMYQNGELFLAGFLVLVAMGTVFQMYLSRRQKLKLLEQAERAANKKNNALKYFITRSIDSAEGS